MDFLNGTSLDKLSTPWIYDSESNTFYLNCPVDYFKGFEVLFDHAQHTNSCVRYHEASSCDTLILGPLASGDIAELFTINNFGIIILDPENEYFAIKDDLLYSKHSINDNQIDFEKVVGCCKNEGEITIPQGVKTIGKKAFETHYSIKKVNFPNSLLTIGDSAFMCCHLKSVVIPDSVTDIAYRAFEVASIENLTLGNGVANIGDGAFYGNHFKNLKITKSVKSIGKNAFGNASNLEAFEIDEQNNYFKVEDGVLYSKDGKSLVVYPYGKKDEEYKVPATAEAIEDFAFHGQENLKKLYIPKGIKTQPYTFYFCKAEIIEYSDFKLEIEPRPIKPINNIKPINIKPIKETHKPIKVTKVPKPKK